MRINNNKSKLVNRLKRLISHPLFWIMTILGNSMILIGSLLLFHFESLENQALQFIDCLIWSTSLVTTVGYADHSPQTLSGKITILFLMLFGTIFLWSYMAFMVAALISPALNSLEKEVQDFEKEISDLVIEEQKNRHLKKD